MLESAGVEDRNAIRNGSGFVLMVGDIESSDTEFSLDGANGIAQLEAAGGIEVSQRFIKEQKIRAGGKSSSERDALLLSPRERFGPPREKISNLEKFGEFGGALGTLSRGWGAEL